jgi:hypothetical protein
MLIIWLQGIWLPLHGYDFEHTPLWAGIFMLPLTVGFLIAGPLSGYLSDRFGARLFSISGLILVAAAFIGLLLLPVEFPYPAFAALLLLSGIGQGMFSAPNTSAIMGSVPPDQRGVASGMRATFQNCAGRDGTSGQVRSAPARLLSAVSRLALTMRGRVGRRAWPEVSPRTWRRSPPGSPRAGGRPWPRRWSGSGC